MERSKATGVIVWILVAMLSLPFLQAEEEKAPPFASGMKEGKFSHKDYSAVVFGSLNWKRKGKTVKEQIPARLSLVRKGKTEEVVKVDIDNEGNFILQVTPGDCEIRSLFSRGRGYTLGHSFTLGKNTVCYIGEMTLDCSGDTLDYYDYRFTIDSELNPKKLNRQGSSWMAAIRLIPAELRKADGKMDIFVPNVKEEVQRPRREEKNLVKAAENGDMITVEAYLAAKRPLDAGDAKGRTPLMAALQAGERTIAERLLLAGADLEKVDEDGWTPLMFALGFSQPDIAKKLIEKGVEIATVSKTGWSPLHLAARYNMVENARMLIEKGADIQAKTGKGGTALSMALQYSDEDLALWLLDRGADGNCVEGEGWTPLMTALRYGKPKAARRLLDGGADIHPVTHDGWSALMFAVRNDLKDIALDLISRGANPQAANKKGFSTLHLAAKYGSIVVLETLLNQKIPLSPVDNEGWTPLHQALREERGEAALMLMARGADLTRKTADGWNPLHLALRNNQAQAARQLILKGAGLAETLPDGWNPLMLALRYGQAENARLLIERKAGLNARNSDGWSPLMHALRYDQGFNARLLIEKGADPKSSIPNGWTALHFAIEFGQPENARLLIAKGAVKDARNPDGKTALELAQAKGYSEIVRLLGGDPLKKTSPASLPAASGASWLPGPMGQFIPQRPGARIIKADRCGEGSSLCSAQLEMPGSKKEALEGFKRDLIAAGWRLDQAISAPNEKGTLGNPALWGLLNVIRDSYNITMLILSDQKSGGRTVVDISLINRNPGFDAAAFARQLPRVIVTPSLPAGRFEADDWCFTLKKAEWCGPKIDKDMGFGTPKTTYTAQGEGMDLLRIQLLLEARDNKPIQDRFMKIAIRLRDKQGNLYSPVLVGTSTGDYFNLSQGGMQSAMVPMQPQSDMDWVFALPRGSIVEALIWPGLEPISLLAR